MTKSNGYKITKNKNVLLTTKVPIPLKKIKFLVLKQFNLYWSVAYTDS